MTNGPPTIAVCDVGYLLCGISSAFMHNYTARHKLQATECTGSSLRNSVTVYPAVGSCLENNNNVLLLIVIIFIY